MNANFPGVKELKNGVCVHLRLAKNGLAFFVNSIYFGIIVHTARQPPNSSFCLSHYSSLVIICNNIKYGDPEMDPWHLEHDVTYADVFIVFFFKKHCYRASFYVLYKKKKAFINI